jgi:uncharacterized protein (DUF1501 family)
VNTLTRRRFLAYSTMATAAAAAGTAGWLELADRTRTDPLPPGAPVLVLVTLYGGNDGLNTVVPAADPAYHSARPDLAYDEGEVLDLRGWASTPAWPASKRSGTAARSRSCAG